MLGCVFRFEKLVVTIAHRHRYFFSFTLSCGMAVMDTNVMGSESETAFRRALKLLGLQGKDWVTPQRQCCRAAARKCHQIWWGKK